MKKKGSSSRSPSMSAEERRYQLERDTHTLREYAELKGNQSRLRAAESALRKETRQVQSVLGKAGRK